MWLWTRICSSFTAWVGRFSRFFASRISRLFASRSGSETIRSPSQLPSRFCPPSFLLAMDRLMQMQHEQNAVDGSVLSFLPMHQTVFDLLSPTLFIVQRYQQSSSDEITSLWSVFSIRTTLWLLQFFGVEGEWLDTLKPLYFSARQKIQRDSPLAVALAVGNRNISQRFTDVLHGLMFVVALY